MKWKNKKRFIAIGLTAFLVIAASLFLYYIMFHGARLKSGLLHVVNILMPIVLGLCTAYLLTPVLNFIEYHILRPVCDLLKIGESRRRNSVLRGIGILATTALFVALVYSLFAMILSQIIPSISSIAANFDQYVNNITVWVNKIMDNNPTMKNYIVNLIDNYSEELLNFLNENLLKRTSSVIVTVSLSIINVLKLAWNFLIGFVISLYVLAAKEKFAGEAKKAAFALFERNTANVVINNFRFTHKAFIGFLSGKVIDSIIIGIICFIGTSILKTPYAALVSMVIGVTNIIPFFGPYLGAIPSLVLIFVVDPMHPLNCLYFAIFILLLQQFDGNILGPKILGNSTGLSGFWVIFAITLFGGLFGILGMIIGVPLFAVIYASFKSVLYAKLRKKELPTESDLYTDLCLIDDDGMHTYTPEYKKRFGDKNKNRFGKRYVSRLERTEIDGIIRGNDTEPADTSAQENAAQNASQDTVHIVDNGINIAGNSQSDKTNA